MFEEEIKSKALYNNSCEFKVKSTYEKRRQLMQIGTKRCKG
jgi:hypothetical protein